MKIRALVLLCVAALLVACGFDIASPDGEDTSAAESALTATLTRIEVSPYVLSLPAGFSQKYKATGFYSNGKKKDLTSAVTWSTGGSAPADGGDGDAGAGSGASIDATGVLLTYSPGSVTVTAVDQASGVSGNATLNVDDRTILSLKMTPVGKNVAIGGTQQMKLTATLSDGSKLPLSGSAVYWSSAAPWVASIDANGVVTGLASGATSISAYGIFGGFAATTLTVDTTTLSSIAVTGYSGVLPVGQLTFASAYATFSDGSAYDVTPFATWTSSNQAVATVNAYGIVTAQGTGKATITAHYQGKTGSFVLLAGENTLVSLRVAAGFAGPLYVGQPAPVLAYGTFRDGSEVDVTATVTWSSSNEKVFTVSNADGEWGQLTAYKAGQAKATATDPATGKKASATFTPTYATVSSLDIADHPPTIAVGWTQDYEAIATFADATSFDETSHVTWASSNSAVLAFVAGSPPGVATGIADGTATVTATWVYNKVTFTATSTQTVVTRAPTNLVVTLNNGGNQIPKGITAQADAVLEYNVGSSDDVFDSVTWTATPSSVLTISNASGSKGLVTAVGKGAGTITATDADGRTASLVVSVIDPVPTALSFSAADKAALLTLKVNGTYKLTPQARFSDGTTGALPNTYRALFSAGPPPLSVVSVTPNYIAQGVRAGTGTLLMSMPPTPWSPVTPTNTTVTVTP